MRSVSHPEKTVPAMSKMPTRASSPAAVVSGMPWSWAAGMKCVPTSPFVEIPQMAKPPASSQKTLVRAASRRPRGPAAPGGRPGGPGVRSGCRRGAVGGEPQVARVIVQAPQDEWHDGEGHGSVASAAERHPLCSASRA